MTENPASPMSDDDILARAKAIKQERDAIAAQQKQAAASALAALAGSSEYQTVFSAISVIHGQDTLDMEVGYLVSMMDRLAKRSNVTLST